MFAAITIRGLGPHADTHLPLHATGHTFIQGRSEAGKSVLIDAACFALFGVDREGAPLAADALRDGAQVVEVTLTTGRGAAIRRDMDRKRKTSRAFSDEVFGTEEAFAARLGDVARRVAGGAHLARLVMAPFSWVPLADGAGGGRPLRDALVSLLPGDDRETVARLMAAQGDELRDTDVLDLKTAESNRRAANSTRDQAVGRRDQAQLAVDSVGSEPASPSRAQLEAARALIMEAAAWDGYDRARLDWERKNEARSNARGALADWERRERARGHRPNFDELAHQSAVAALRRARLRLDEAVYAVRQANEQQASIEGVEDATVRALRGAVAAAEAKVHTGELADGRCPHCQQDWPDAAAGLAAARAELEAAKRDFARAEADAAGVRSRALARVLEELKAKEVAHREAVDEVDACTASVSELEAARARATAWDEERRRDPRPQAGPELAEAPNEPPYPRPEAAAVAAARQLVSDAQTAEGSRNQWGRQRGLAHEALQRAQAELARAEAAAAHQAALVDAIRRAPGARFADLLALLGDTGPVGLVAPEDEKRALDINIDGRPWRLASRGRQVYADACLRAAIRRAGRMRYLPLFIDEAGAWSGELPALEGPVIVLRTADVPLTSSAAVREAA